MTDMILPEGWVEARLGDIFFIKNGYAFKSSDFVLRQKDSYPVIRISDMRDGVVNDTNSTHILLKNISDIFLINNGDLLIAMSGATTGKIGVYQNNNPAYLNQRVGNVKPYSTKYSCNKFRNLLFMLLKEDILKIAYGGAQPNISSSRIESLFIKLPPLAEQEEIAQRVDRAIGHVDELKSRLETLLTTLKTFRQSILNAAVIGKLTESWTVTPLKELTIKIGSGSTPKGGQEVYKTTGIPLIRSMNIHFDKIKFEDLVYIDDKQADKLKNVAVKENDILLNITGASIGRVNIAPSSLKGARVNQHVSILRCKPELLFPKFLKTILSSTLIQNWINNENYGATRQALTKSMIENLEISFPPLEEQEEIVKRVEAYFALADQIEKQVQSALDKVNLLTQTILAKAFRGELTKEWRQKNPELISGENSAEALLKRIKAEKEALEKSSKKTPRSKVKIL